MKKSISLILWLSFIVCTENYAQSRKFISQFSHFQSYFNPGLTGYEGSTVRSFVRNQWGGIEGAPKTFFLSSELDFAELRGVEDPALLGKNAASINLMHNRYGAFLETEIIYGYASRIRISSNHNLRLGVGVNHRLIRLDGNNLTGEFAQDPVIMQYQGSFANLQVLDFNIGLALTHSRYYFSYGVQQANRGRLYRGDNFMDNQALVHVVQAGYRERLNDNFSLIGNVFYRHEESLIDNIEFNIKSVMMDRLWMGGGYRHQYAYNLQMGFLWPGMRMGYIYEVPTNRSLMYLGQTHEFMLVFNLIAPKEIVSTNRPINIW
ncbi:PorP/SprF family type IX secretion system membrane protein [Pleomorphovibrio marinus]|uniref:PorP/SprF family type IX secretion system membrane protein n=1 Tax=Pleomorphovibrio marinus TaxID=2164132 RepID=UPI000E0AD524|nr:PorP/SprF family type IX secretion system membrane protein [Pleomorphovibrio marinus]